MLSNFPGRLWDVILDLSDLSRLYLSRPFPAAAGAAAPAAPAAPGVAAAPLAAFSVGVAGAAGS